MADRDDSLHPSRTTAQAESTRKSSSQSTRLGVEWVFPQWRAPRPFTEQRTLLGRATDCGMCLEGKETSRQHAEVLRQGLLWKVRDLGSRNGVFLDGKRISESLLCAGSVLRVGEWVGVLVPCDSERAMETGFHPIATGLWGGRRMAAVLEPVRRAATAKLPIVIEGETGTGKECVARAIHQWSGRKGPYLGLNCAALPHQLAEGELFGHEKGAFSDATSPRPGHLRAADKGTLVLDEVADLPLDVQPKLLRALQEQSVMPLGASRTAAVDVRIVSLAQSPLRRAVESGRFRADLYARLNGLTVRVPPLRERREDVPGLLGLFLSQECPRPVSYDARLVESLCAYDYPLNVRELQSLVVRLATLYADRDTFRRSYLPEEFSLPRPDSARPSAHAVGVQTPRHAADRGRRPSAEAMIGALQATGGNVAQAADMLGITRQAAYRVCEKARIKPDSYRR